MSEELRKVNPENRSLYDKIMQLVEQTCFRMEASGVPVEVSREAEIKATAEIKKLIEGMSNDEIHDALVYSVYLNIATALEAVQGNEEVGYHV